MYLILTDDHQVIEKDSEDVRYIGDGFYGVFEGLMEVPYHEENVCEVGSHCTFDEGFTRRVNGGLMVTGDIPPLGYAQAVRTYQSYEEEAFLSLPFKAVKRGLSQELIEMGFAPAVDINLQNPKPNEKEVFISGLPFKKVKDQLSLEQVQMGFAPAIRLNSSRNISGDALYHVPDNGWTTQLYFVDFGIYWDESSQTVTELYHVGYKNENGSEVINNPDHEEYATACPLD